MVIRHEEESEACSVAKERGGLWQARERRPTGVTSDGSGPTTGGSDNRRARSCKYCTTRDSSDIPPTTYT